MLENFGSSMGDPYIQFGVAVLMRRDAEAIQLLRQKALDPNGRFGRSPLSIASEHGSISVMRELVELGARVDRVDADGHTPLWHAAAKNSAPAISLLLEHGARTQLNEALSLASHRGHLEAAQALIDGGANVNFRGYGGETPLLVAVTSHNGLWNLQGQYDEVIALLLLRGADPSIVRDDGYSAKQLADLRRLSLVPPTAAMAPANKGGCYVATAVYGSYDSPEVLVLRNFRDRSLSSTRLGRAAISIYYSLSPILVRHVGKYPWFGALVRPPLDAMIGHLQRLEERRSAPTRSGRVR